MTDLSGDIDNFYEFANRFLNENTHLFTTLGVFGAIAVYLGKFTTNLSASYVGLAIEIGFFSSLLLFFLVGSLINRRYKRKYEEFRGVPPIFPHKSNLIPFIPLLLFDALIVAVLGIVIATVLDSWLYFLSSAIFLSLFYIVFMFTLYISAIVTRITEFNFENVAFWTSFISFISVILIDITARFFVYPTLTEPLHQISFTIFAAVEGALCFIAFYLGVVQNTQELIS